MVSIFWCEPCPLRNGFLIGRDLFSGDGARSMPFAPLLERPPKTVPKRLRPPKLLFCGGAGAVISLVLCFGLYQKHVPVPDLEAIEKGLGLSSSRRTRSRDGVRVGGDVALGIGAGAGSAIELPVVALRLASLRGAF